MPTPATDTGLASGSYLSDSYGSLTATAGTALVRTIPPRAGLRARATGFSYTAGLTEHTLTFLVAFAEVSVKTDAAANQNAISLRTVPTAADGSLMAINDFIVFQHEDGSWAAYKISTVSGLDLTLSTNLSQKVRGGTRCFFMGAPGDHTDRQYKIAISTTITIHGSDARCVVATAAKNDQPIVAHADNITNQGTLRWLGFVYADA